MDVESREYHIPRFSELRIRLHDAAVHASTKVTVVSGEEDRWAEVLGVELRPGRPTVLPHREEVCVFSPTGCVVALSAPAIAHQSCFVTNSATSWMHSLLDIHHSLEEDRGKAKASDSFGPRSLFVCESTSEETSLYVQWLSQYAVRLGYYPLLLDCTAFYGYESCLSLFSLQYPTDLECEMTFVPGVHICCGHEKVVKPALFKNRLDKLYDLSVERMARDERSRVGGLFLNYGTIHSDEDMSTLVDVVQDCDIDRIFVIGSARLRFKLFRTAMERRENHSLGFVEVGPEFPRTDGGQCKIYLLDSAPVVGGLDEIKRQQWRRYFFGCVPSVIRPTLVTVEASSIRLAVIGDKEDSSMSTLMPMVDRPDAELPRRDPATVRFLNVLDLDLKGRLLAISTATEFVLRADGSTSRLTFSDFEERVRQSFVKGFTMVESVSNGKITLLVTDPTLLRDDGPCLFITSESLHVTL